MKVNIELHPKVTLELSEREAVVVEQALFLVAYTGSAFSNEVADININLSNKLDDADIALLPADTR